MRGATLQDMSLMDQARKAYAGPSQQSPTPEQKEAGRKHRRIERMQERQRELAALRDPWEAACTNK